MENTLKNAYEFLSELSDAAPKMSLPEALVEYATSVRPVVVLPSEDQGGCIALDLVPDLEENEQAFFIAGFQTCIRWLNNNPDLTFTSPAPIRAEVSELTSKITELQERFDENGYDCIPIIKLQRIEQHINMAIGIYKDELSAANQRIAELQAELKHAIGQIKGPYHSR